MKLTTKLRLTKLWLAILGLLVTLFLFATLAEADVVSAPRSNIVRILLDTEDGGSGSGFITDKGKLMTARHVVTYAEKRLIIVYCDGTKETIAKEDFKVSGKYDLATADTKYNKLGRKLELTEKKHVVGTEIYTVGFPSNWGVRWSSTGIISSEIIEVPVNDPYDPTIAGVFMSDMDSMGGSSGSAVFNEEDELVGVLVAGLDCITFVVGTDAIREFLDE